MLSGLTDKLAQERRARLAAERLLEQKKKELFSANQKLALHARSLSDQIVQQRQGLAIAMTEAEALKGANFKVLGDLERANSAALIAQRRLWESLETIRDGFAVFDNDLRLVAANRAWLSFFKGQIAVAPRPLDSASAPIAVEWKPEASAAWPNAAASSSLDRKSGG